MVVTLENHNASDMIRRDSLLKPQLRSTFSVLWHLHTGGKVARIFGKDKLHKVAQPAFESFTVHQAEPSVNFSFPRNWTPVTRLDTNLCSTVYTTNPRLVTLNTGACLL